MAQQEESIFDQLTHSGLLRYKCNEDKNLVLLIGVFRGSLNYSVMGNGACLYSFKFHTFQSLLSKRIWENVLQPAPDTSESLIKRVFNSETKKWEEEYILLHGYNSDKRPYLKIVDCIGNRKWSFDMYPQYGVSTVNDANDSILQRTTLQTYIDTITVIAEQRKAISAVKFKPQVGGGKSGGGYKSSQQRSAPSIDPTDEIPF